MLTLGIWISIVASAFAFIGIIIDVATGFLFSTKIIRSIISIIFIGGIIGLCILMPLNESQYITFCTNNKEIIKSKVNNIDQNINIVSLAIRNDGIAIISGPKVNTIKRALINYGFKNNHIIITNENSSINKVNILY